MGHDLTNENRERYFEHVKTIDWSCMAEPQVDGYDTARTLELAAIIYGDVSKTVVPADRPRLLGGRVPMMHGKYQPTSELFHAPFDHPNIALGEQMLDHWPAMREQLAGILTEVWPLTDGKFEPYVPIMEVSGGTCGNTDRWGGINTTVIGGLGFAECMIHEAYHHKMHALGVHLESWDNLIANTFDEMFESPIRKDKPRPMGACVQAQYSYLGVLEMNIIATKAGFRCEMFKLNRDRMRAGYETLRSWRPTPVIGEAFKSAMDAWTVRILDEATALLGD